MIVTHIERMLDELEPHWRDLPDMIGTPERVAKMFEHFFRNHKQEEIDVQLSKVFPTTNDQLIIVKDIQTFGLCPHHLLPIVYNIHIGYIPNGKALGLSKLARLSILLAAYPMLQENYTNKIADELEKALSPLGIMVVVSGVHGCMRFRGVERNATTMTSDCRGVMREKSEARSEFLQLIGGNK